MLFDRAEKLGDALLTSALAVRRLPHLVQTDELLRRIHHGVHVHPALRQPLHHLGDLGAGAFQPREPAQRRLGHARAQRGRVLLRGLDPRGRRVRSGNMPDGGTQDDGEKDGGDGDDVRGVQQREVGVVAVVDDGLGELGLVGSQSEGALQLSEDAVRVVQDQAAGERGDERELALADLAALRHPQLRPVPRRLRQHHPDVLRTLLHLARQVHRRRHQQVRVRLAQLHYEVEASEVDLRARQRLLSDGHPPPEFHQRLLEVDAQQASVRERESAVQMGVRFPQLLSHACQLGFGEGPILGLRGVVVIRRHTCPCCGVLRDEVVSNQEPSACRFSF
nr:hypothetical protein CFP56_68764 [Quercus suber]